MSEARFAGVVFDCDGLTLDTEVCYTRAETALFAEHGLEFGPDDKRALLGTGRVEAQAILERLMGLPGAGVELFARLHELVMVEVGRDVDPMPGAVALVDAIRATGRPVAIATNSTRDFVELALTTAGIRDRFDAVVPADEVARGKPHPDVYLEACRAIGLDPARGAGLEDSPTGAAAVRAAGLFLIGVPSYPGVVIEDADLLGTSLEDPAVLAALGL